MYYIMFSKRHNFKRQFDSVDNLVKAIDNYYTERKIISCKDLKILVIEDGCLIGKLDNPIKRV